MLLLLLWFIAAFGEEEEVKFTAELGSKNGVCGEKWDFRIVETEVKDGKNYASTIISECKRHNMLPACEHPSYCKAFQAEAHYIGQGGHLSTIWRNPNDGPPGFDKIKDYFKDICFYSRNAGGDQNALCSVGNGHAWRTNAQGPRKFMCLRMHEEPDLEPDFEADLGVRNGVCPYKWEFSVGKVCDQASGRYDYHMIRECKKFGMRPICEHPSYCKNDGNSLYLGQNAHLSYEGGRNSGPPGFDKITDHWKKKCNYSSGANGGNALCNHVPNSHTWQQANGSIKEFICGRVKQTENRVDFQAQLGPYEGVRVHDYDFAKTKYDCSGRGGNYSNAQILQCMTLGMKPICDHQSYCEYNYESIYIGQRDHLAYWPYRQRNDLMPPGFAEIKDHWDGMCTYTAKGNGDTALCNNDKTHSWQHPNSSYNRFICGIVVVDSVSPTLVPTRNPTGVPTPHPSFLPTGIPTKMPRNVHVNPTPFPTEDGTPPQPKGKRCLLDGLNKHNEQVLAACEIVAEVEACKAQRVGLLNTIEGLQNGLQQCQHSLQQCRSAHGRTPIALYRDDTDETKGVKLVTVLNYHDLRMTAKKVFTNVRTNTYFTYTAIFVGTDGKERTLDVNVYNDADLIAAFAVANKTGKLLTLYLS